MAQVTLEDVAKLAGVSIKTVSRVLNNEPNVAPLTAEKIKTAIAELNYVPNMAARNLLRGRAMAIGLVIGWPVASPFASMLIEATLKECMSKGYSLALFNYGENLTQQIVQAFLGRQVDGIILDTMSAESEELITQINKLNMPHVVVHPNRLHKGRASYIRIDNITSAKLGVEHLISLGHRVIACAGYKPYMIQEDDRLLGYRRALEEAGIPVRKELISDGTGQPFQAGFDGTLTILRAHPEVTAVFAVSDEIAMGALAAIYQLGLRVPDDISVVGFDDISYAGMLVPPLTTVHQPIFDIASSAVRHLVNMIGDNQTPAIVETMPTFLVVRETSRAPRSIAVMAE